MRIRSRARTAGSRQQPTFCQAFPNLACFRPSFSKHFFGGFVGFQGVTRFPNLNVRFPSFLPFSMRCNSRRGRRAAKSVRIVEVDMEAPYHRFRFTERKIADCPPRPQLTISADEHRESQIVELQDTPEFTFFNPCHRALPCRQLGIGGRVTVIPEVL